MKSESKDTPVTIGAEVEMTYPTSWPNSAIQEACLPFLKTVPHAIEYGYSVATLMQHHSGNEGATGVDGSRPRPWAVHAWEKDTLPEEYRSPLGWERGWESQHEFRFHGPAQTLKEAFGRFDNLGAYFKAWGHRTPNSGYGTHIHLGVRDWINRVFPGTREDWQNSKVARLLYGTIWTRNHILNRLIPSHRRSANSGGAWGYLPFVEATPLAQIHTYFAQRGNIVSGACQANRKGFPTFEVRTYASTVETRAIQGWVALLIFMVKNLERLISKEVLDSFPEYRPAPGAAHGYAEDGWALAAPTVAPENPLTKDILVNPSLYTVDHLKEELRATGFWSAPLISWIDETLKKNGKECPFEGSLYEIYDTDGIAQTEDASKAGSGKRKSARFLTAEPLAAAA